jgi:mono/diheme cytochrome c family protein
MKTRKIVILASAACLLALLLPGTVLAGGWAAIVLDRLPADPAAGQPLTVGFTVLQHGHTPMSDLTPTVTLENPASGESIVVNTRPDGEPGHYTAELLFPTGGIWEWSIQAFTMDQPMPPLEVSGAGQAPASPRPLLPASLPLLLGLFSLACLGGALFLLMRTRPRWALVLLLAGLLLGGAGLASAANRTSASTSPPSGSQSLVETGQRLFMAKGCVTCHNHEAIERRRFDTIYVDIGPNLSDFTADPDYLRRWLADPASIRPKAGMPNLKLEPDEIEALIAFLNAE